MIPPSRQNSGDAIVIVLAIIVIATILIVGFAASMRTERQASASMANDIRAKLIAQSAMQHATAILEKNIPQPNPPGTPPAPTSSLPYPPGALPSPANWVISPGLLTVTPGPSPAATPNYIPLSTNPSADYVPDPTNKPNQDANLNIQSVTSVTGTGGADYAIANDLDPKTGKPAVIGAAWVPVLQDPTQPASAANPIIGRYAFFMDDENARININTAYGKPAATNMHFQYTNPLDQAFLNASGQSSDAVDVLLGGFNNYSVFSPGNVSGSSAAYNNSTGAFAPTTHSYSANSLSNAVGASNNNPDSRRYYPLWHPTAVNLNLLGGGFETAAVQNKLADWIFNSTTMKYNGSGANQPAGNWRLLTSPDQIKQFVTGSTTGDVLYRAHKFNLTTSGRVPEFNTFGKPRMFMQSGIHMLGGFNDATTTPLDGTLLYFQAPDYDAQGPTYFHGHEIFQGANLCYSPKGYQDLNGVKMVADNISDMLSRNDWPGMPAKSFVDKWQAEAQANGSLDPNAGKREADQVAWNIVAMGNYAAGAEGTNGSGWPEGGDQYFRSTQNAPFLASGGNPLDHGNTTLPDATKYLTQYTSFADGNGNSLYLEGWHPNASLCLGKLSGKAIMPFYAKPRATEVALQILPQQILAGADPAKISQSVRDYIWSTYQVDAYGNKDSNGKPQIPSPAAGYPTGLYSLQISLAVEFYQGKRFQPADMGYPCQIIPLLFSYTVGGGHNLDGSVISTISQTGYEYDHVNCSAHNPFWGPTLDALSGARETPNGQNASVGTIPVPPGGYFVVTTNQEDPFTYSGTTTGNPGPNGGSNGVYVSVPKGNTNTFQQAKYTNFISAGKITDAKAPTIDNSNKVAYLTPDSTVVGFSATDTLNVDAHLRFMVCWPASSNNGNGNCVSQIIPIWDTKDNPPPPPGFTESALAPPPGESDSLEFKFSFNVGTMFQASVSQGVIDTRISATPPNISGSNIVYIPPADPKRDADVPSRQLIPQPITYSLEVADPRTGNMSSVWTPVTQLGATLANLRNDTLTAPNVTLQPHINQQGSYITTSGTIQTTHTNSNLTNYTYTGYVNNATTKLKVDFEKYAYFDFQRDFYSNSPCGGIGFLSCIPTNMQRGTRVPTDPVTGKQVATLSFQPATDANNLPDWLLLDMLAPTFCDLSNATWAPYSYMHSTMGKININGGNLYNVNPNNTVSSGSSTQRWIPLQALFQNMSASTTVTAPAAAGSAPSPLVQNILNHKLASGAAAFGSLASSTHPQYDYVGELCQIAGFSDGTDGNGTSINSFGDTGHPYFISVTGGSTQYWDPYEQALAANPSTTPNSWDKEYLIRNLVDLMTTNSNAFRVWGVAQSVKKKAGNTNYGQFETGDIVSGEKRFESTIERYVWPGKDGLPGNAQLANGTYSASTISHGAQAIPSPTQPSQPVRPWSIPAYPSNINKGAINTTQLSGLAFPAVDGPDSPTYYNGPSGASSPAPSPGWASQNYTGTPIVKSNDPDGYELQLMNANNPVGAHMQYRVNTFRFLNE